MKLSVLAIAAALSLPASITLAQDAKLGDMMSGLSMPETNAAMAFRKHVIDAEPDH